MPNDPKKANPVAHLISLSDLSGTGNSSFDITPDAGERRAIAEFLGIRQIKKLRFHVKLTPHGKGDWQMKATLGASVVQDCVVTGAPVSTRIDKDTQRLYRRDWSETSEQNEAEFDGDVESEPLGTQIDLGLTMLESLALALPDYPKIDGAGLPESVFAAPGSTPLRDSDMKPFASLAELRDKLTK